MSKKIRYQCRCDLKLLREAKNWSREDLADEIGYSVRNLARIERENAVTLERTAHQLCNLYNIDYNNSFYILDASIRDSLMKLGRTPISTLHKASDYYLLYIKKIDFFKDCIAGKVGWIGDYNRNKERRILRKANASIVLLKEPHVPIINTSDEWYRWYLSLTIGKLYKVLVSEACMKECLSSCLQEIIVKRKDLMIFDGINDIAFLGTKQKQ